MPERGKGERAAGRGVRGSRWLISLVVGGLAAACAERDRLTFPNQSDGIGPVTLIDRPGEGDTTIDAGPTFFVNGRSIDRDGVDTVYFLVSGGNQGFPPLRPSPPADTARFGVPLSTNGRSGQAIQLQIYAVDGQGNQGAPATRQIIIR
jgi:hypothetical protein